MLQQSSNLEEIPWILLQTTLIMLVDDDWIKNQTKFMQKIGEKWERKNEEFLDLDLDFRILLC